MVRLRSCRFVLRNPTMIRRLWMLRLTLATQICLKPDPCRLQSSLRRSIKRTRSSSPAWVSVLGEFDSDFGGPGKRARERHAGPRFCIGMTHLPDTRRGRLGWSYFLGRTPDGRFGVDRNSGSIWARRLRAFSAPGVSPYSTAMRRSRARDFSDWPIFV